MKLFLHISACAYPQVSAAHRGSVISARFCMCVSAGFCSDSEAILFLLVSAMSVSAHFCNAQPKTRLDYFCTFLHISAFSYPQVSATTTTLNYFCKFLRINIRTYLRICAHFCTTKSPKWNFSTFMQVSKTSLQISKVYYIG